MTDIPNLIDGAHEVLDNHGIVVIPGNTPTKSFLEGIARNPKIKPIAGTRPKNVIIGTQLCVAERTQSFLIIGDLSAAEKRSRRQKRSHVSSTHGAIDGQVNTAFGHVYRFVDLQHLRQITMLPQFSRVPAFLMIVKGHKTFDFEHLPDQVKL